QKARILELKRRYFEDYYSDNQYAVSIKEDTAMDDLNITMEEYIRLEEEKAQKHAFNKEVSSEKTLSCEPTVSSLNDEIDFRILFDDFDDEGYMVIFDKNSFSYKIISTNDLKTDSENDNEKVNMPSLLPPEPTVSCFDDLDFFNDFENEFPTIIYNDAQTSKSDLLTELIFNPQHIDEFDLNDETSLSEYDEEEQNVLYFNDLFPFNIIHPDDLKSKKDNDDNEIHIMQSSGEVPQQALPSPPPLVAARTMPQRMARLEEDVNKIHGALAEQREVIGAMAMDFSRFTVWAASCIAQLLDFARVTYMSYSKIHIPYQRRVRCRTDSASTSIAQQDQQQPDP
ncbi:hypothetical protein Tco_0241384, partial [Tanacetum coccineum]